MMKHDTKATSILYGLKPEYSSRNEEIIASICTNWKVIFYKESYIGKNSLLTTLSKPRKNNIMKKSMAQNCGNGSIPMASG